MPSVTRSALPYLTALSGLMNEPGRQGKRSALSAPSIASRFSTELQSSLDGADVNRWLGMPLMYYITSLPGRVVHFEATLDGMLTATVP
jgi:hypothetical protein